MTPQQMAFIEARHARYQEQQQQDPYGSPEAFLEAEDARTYRKFRRFFDSLPYASDFGSRFYSFVDERNFTELTHPEVLRDGTGYTVTRGTWRIKTTDPRFIEALMRLLANGEPHVMKAPLAMADHNVMADAMSGTVPIYLEATTDAEFDAVCNLIDRFHGGDIMPREPLPAEPEPAAAPPTAPAAPIATDNRDPAEVFRDLVERCRRPGDAWL